MKTKVLVTGSQGQLGKTLHHLYHNTTEDLEFVFVSKSDLDITNKDQMTSFFSTHQFDYCVNCAAYTNVEQSETQPELAFNVNAEAVKNLAEICKDKNIILIHISTDYVFDGNANQPYTEEDLTNPINEYGKSKLQGELEIKNILNDFFIIRTSWLYSRFGHNFVKTIIKKIKENSDLKITTSQTGTPTSCDELSQFIFFLINSKSTSFGVYHFSSLGETTWYDFALEISKQFKHYNTLEISPITTFKTKAERPKYSVLSNLKSNQIFKKRECWKDQVIKTVKSLI
ncbi:MAG: dTDP-4-dehydrorhamnose reductase [Psychroserpens sp.]|nr:dTDP-4-dehydrorhamnose reductase [Psychroserpens sp.]